MDLVILTQVGGLLKPFAWVFGQIFNWLFELTALMGIENVALTVVLFTIVTKLILTPLTIKQQKFTKLSNKMNPELQAIQEKYKGKKDEKSMRLSQMETQKVYEKYGANPASGCLPLLITIPIMFAMYRVIYAIPAYVPKIYDLYASIATQLSGCEGYVDYMKEAAGSLGVAVKGFKELSETVPSISEVHLVDIMTKFGTEQWEALQANFTSLNILDTVNKITKINSLGSFNILNTPRAYGFSLALLIPVLAIVTQLAQSLISKASNPSSNQKSNNGQENPMMQSMNSMLYIMPFVSGFFCWGFPICIGIYWVISSVVTIISQLIINAYMDKIDVNVMIEKNLDKQKERLEKLGVESGSKMSKWAQARAKALEDYRKQTESMPEANETPKNTTSSYASIGGKSHVLDASEKGDVSKKSISGYANMLKKKNDD